MPPLNESRNAVTREDIAEIWDLVARRRWLNARPSDPYASARAQRAADTFRQTDAYEQRLDRLHSRSLSPFGPVWY